jgi:hypothetical protein
MKKKVRDRLDRIEQCLKDLVKAVAQLHPAPPRSPQRGSNEDAVPPVRKTKAIDKMGAKSPARKGQRTLK